MKIAFLALVFAIGFAHYEWEHVTDNRTAAYNISEFMQGFAYGAFEESIADITDCANDTVDIIQTIQRDIHPIIEGTTVQRAAAITDLIWHLVRDIPDILSQCGQLKNDTIDIIHITEKIFEEIIHFRKFAHDLLSEFGPTLKLLTTAAIAIEHGDWYKGGLNVGKVFKIIASHAAKKMITQ